MSTPEDDEFDLSDVETDRETDSDSDEDDLIPKFVPNACSCICSFVSALDACRDIFVPGEYCRFLGSKVIFGPKENTRVNFFWM